MLLAGDNFLGETPIMRHYAAPHETTRMSKLKSLSHNINGEIEILRGISVTLVMIAHIPVFFPWLSAYWWPVFQHAHFWFGVDIFFAISGFVVTSSLLRQIKINRNEPKIKIITSFAIRRFFRLIPLSWAALLFVLFLSLTWNSTGIFGSAIGILGDAVAVVFYSANWHAYQCVKEVTPLCGINAHYWSLSLEEQFYIVLPLTLLFFRKYLLPVCLLLIAIQFPLQRDIFSSLWITRIDPILYGVVIALIKDTDLYLHIKPGMMRNVKARWTFIVVMLVSMSLLAGGKVISFSVGLLAVASGLFVLIASYNEGLLFPSLAKNRVLLWLGSRSYALYLLHSVAFFIVIEGCSRIAGSRTLIETPEHTLALAIGGVLMTIALVEVAHRLIEVPFRRLGNKPTEKMLQQEDLTKEPT
ncbi:acyltransferase [Pseudomonas serboccidentalis]|uniref:Acyltransferase n=1 Tax=Pseudomonas serboccidentalis TaxID=2964670 RepID=A0ABY7ZE52_9PSED|nr:acyltransferase [Pseudomonas serboccidentalis]WDR37995.1 acyltransferase [Pseudomonas serboccidentalis]